MRSRKPLLIGKKISDGRMSWKGADKTSNFYVGQVHIDVDPKEITSEIESLGVQVIELEEIKRIPKRYKSFRLCIRKSDLPKLLVDDFWPEGVRFDRFFWPKDAQRGAPTVS